MLVFWDTGLDTRRVDFCFKGFSWFGLWYVWFVYCGCGFVFIVDDGYWVISCALICVFCIKLGILVCIVIGGFYLGLTFVVLQLICWTCGFWF